MNYFFLLKKQMCLAIPDETSVCGVVNYPIVTKCWCMRDRSAHKGLGMPLIFTDF